MPPPLACERPYPPNSVGRHATRVYLLLCGVNWTSALNWPPHKASLSPKRPMQDPRDSGVSAAVWGGGGGWKKANIQAPPRGVPIPQTAHEGLKKPGVYPPLCGEELGMYPPAPPPPPRGVPNPPNGPRMTGRSRV